MIHLLQLEWLKWRKNTLTVLLFASYILLLPSLLLSVKQMDDLPPPLDTAKQALYIFPTVWEYMGYVGNWLAFFFFGYFGLISITLENGYRTLRQNVITGMTRSEYFWGKIILYSTIALFATVYYVLATLVIGLLHTEALFWSKVTQHADYVPRYFLMCLAYMIFGCFLGVLLKRTTMAFLTYFGYIMFVEPVIRWGIHFYFFRHASMKYYPMNAIEDLTPLPFFQGAEDFLKTQGFSFFLTADEAVMLTLFFSLIFTIFAYWRIHKADL